MRKTGKTLLFILSILSGFAVQATASDGIEVSASVLNSIVYAGEQFSISVQVETPGNRSVSRPQLPELDGLRYISRTPSTNTSYSIVNGVASTSFGFRYFLIADTPGRYTIPSFTFVIEGRTFNTQPINVEVVERGRQPQTGTQLPEIYLQLELTTSNPYVGQQLTAELVLYFRSDIDILSYQPVSSWRTEGFWLENLSEGRGNPRAETVMIQGVRYRKATLMSYALFPTRAGELSLGSYTINVNMRRTARHEDLRERFFSGFGRAQQSVEVRSEAKKIPVRRLPAPFPEGFTGAVGRFSVERTISDQEVYIGEPLEMITTINGSGNLALINHPNHALPEEFDRFNPQESTDIQKSGNVISGSKTFRDVIIPRRAGMLEIPESVFSWFDPGAGRYRTTRLVAQQVRVTRDMSQVMTRAEETRLSLRPVIGVTTWAQHHQLNLFSTWWFYLLAVLPFLIVFLGWARWSYKNRMSTDAGFARYNLADKRAENTLNEAAMKINDTRWRDAYGLLHKAVAIYIADRLGLPEIGYSNAQLAEEMSKKGAGVQLTDQIRKVLDRFSTIQYAPDAEKDSFNDDKLRAESIIRKCRKLT